MICTPGLPSIAGVIIVDTITKLVAGDGVAAVGEFSVLVGGVVEAFDARIRDGVIGDNELGAVSGNFVGALGVEDEELEELLDTRAVGKEDGATAVGASLDSVFSSVIDGAIV